MAAPAPAGQQAAATSDEEAPCIQEFAPCFGKGRGFCAGAGTASSRRTVARARRRPLREPAPVAGLPADAPKLAISGGVYSANVAQRMLIVNGQVFNEGSEIGTGVVLEEIKPKSAVLKFRGSRYTVTY